MRNLISFVEKAVCIKYIDQITGFGHYPFMLFIEQVGGQGTLVTLDFGGDVAACYSEFVKHLKKKPRRVYISIDFPAYGDISHDFVAIFSYENDKISVYAIPYDHIDGTLFPNIYEGLTINQLLSDFSKFTDQV